MNEEKLSKEQLTHIRFWVKEIFLHVNWAEQKFTDFISGIDMEPWQVRSFIAEVKSLLETATNRATNTLAVMEKLLVPKAGLIRKD